MESASELILKGHFSKLKDQINTESEDRHYSSADMIETLQRTVQYMEKQQLDDQGQMLIKDLQTLVHGLSKAIDISVPDKMPMKRAKGKRKVESKNSQTGT